MDNQTETGKKMISMRFDVELWEMLGRLAEMKGTRYHGTSRTALVEEAVRSAYGPIFEALCAKAADA